MKKKDIPGSIKEGILKEYRKEGRTNSLIESREKTQEICDGISKIIRERTEGIWKKKLIGIPGEMNEEIPGATNDRIPGGIPDGMP